MQFIPNTEALKALPTQEGLDAIVAMSPENFAYASGAFISTVRLIRPRLAFAVLLAKGKPFNIVCSIEESLTRAESWIDDVVTYTEFVDVPVEVLARELKKKGLEKGKIGIDLDYLPVSSFETLKAAMPGANFINTTETVAALRAIKSESEIALLEAATKQTHKAVLDAMEASKQGDSEADMAQKIANNIINYGADGTLFMAFASGDRTKHPHTTAQSDVLPRPGDIIRFDVGGTYGAFASDFARTYSAGEPTKEQKEVHAKLVRIQRETIEAVKPGVLAEDLFFLCKGLFEKNGLPFGMPHIGHSFGVELHENPMLRPGDKTPLKPGMVINIEPMVKHSSGAYHTEDLVLVTDDGYRLLTLGLAPEELPVISRTVSY
nr:Xaa-Pro peptidase family protein [Mesorhizobium sp.]